MELIFNPSLNKLGISSLERARILWNVTYAVTYRTKKEKKKNPVPCLSVQGLPGLESQ